MSIQGVISAERDHQAEHEAEREERATIHQAIEKAFPERTLPTAEESLPMMANPFEIKDWRLYSQQELREVRLEVWSLSSDAFYEYLPAAICEMMNHPGEENVMLELVFDALTPPGKDAKLRLVFTDRFATFSYHQRVVLSGVVSWLAMEEPNAPGLSRAVNFWKHYR